MSLENSTVIPINSTLACFESRKLGGTTIVFIYLFYVSLWTVAVIINFIMIILVASAKYLKNSYLGKSLQIVACSELINLFFLIFSATYITSFAFSNSTGYINNLEFLEGITSSSNITLVWFLFIQTAITTFFIRLYKKRLPLHHAPNLFILSGGILFLFFYVIQTSIIAFKLYYQCINKITNQTITLLDISPKKYWTHFYIQIVFMLLPGILKLFLAGYLSYFVKTVVDNKGIQVVPTKNILTIHVYPSILVLLTQTIILLSKGFSTSLTIRSKKPISREDYDVFIFVDAGLNTFCSIFTIISFLFNPNFGKTNFDQIELI